MQIEADALSDVVVRLRRAQGQLGGVITMIESGRECKEIITQLAAVARALDRAGFKMISTGLEQCINASPTDAAAAKVDRDELERLFLTLA